MADYALYTQEAAVVKADEIKAALAASLMRFFQSSLTPTRFTTRDQLVDAECDFDGYTPGGYALATWVGPQNDPQGGVIISSPSVAPTYGPVGDPPATNDVGGYWIEDSDDNVRIVVVYDPPRPMGVIGDGWIEVAQIVEARNVIPTPEG